MIPTQATHSITAEDLSAWKAQHTVYGQREFRHVRMAAGAAGPSVL